MQNGNKLLPQKLIQQLKLLRSEMLQLEASGMADSGSVHSEHRASAANLIHYLALRRHDIRQLQTELATLGLSSLGRNEQHVMGGLDAVLRMLTQLVAPAEAPLDLPDRAPAIGEGATLLEKNSEILLGPPPPGRNVRIMVTMPSEATTDYDLVRDLVLQGMDCMRINCAHDGPEAWSGMVRNLRRAVKETGRPCKISMDLAGPKLRTGPIEDGPAVLKYRPQRDDFGRVVSPARIWLTPESHPVHAPAKADASIGLPARWLGRAKPGIASASPTRAGRPARSRLPAQMAIAAGPNRLARPILLQDSPLSWILALERKLPKLCGSRASERFLPDHRRFGWLSAIRWSSRVHWLPASPRSTTSKNS